MSKRSCRRCCGSSSSPTSRRQTREKRFRTAIFRGWRNQGPKRKTRHRACIGCRPADMASRASSSPETSGPPRRRDDCRGHRARLPRDDDQPDRSGRRRLAPHLLRLLQGQAGVLPRHLRPDRRAPARGRARRPRAGRRTGRDRWPPGSGAALGAFAANPQLALFTLAVPVRAGGEVAARYRVALEAPSPS